MVKKRREKEQATLQAFDLVSSSLSPPDLSSVWDNS